MQLIPNSPFASRSPSSWVFDRHRTRISCQGGGIPYPLPRSPGQCTLLLGIAIWIRHRPQGLLTCGSPSGVGHRISGSRYHHLSEERGERTHHCRWSLGDGGDRLGMWYGHVCGGGCHHVDGTVGLGGAQRLHPSTRHHDHRVEFLGFLT